MKTNNFSKKLIKFSKLFGRSLFLLLFSFFFFYLAFDRVAPNVTVDKLGFKLYSIVSGSMEPKLSRGDLIVVQKHDFNDLNENDIITIRNSDNKYVTHYFVKYEYKYTSVNGINKTEKVIRTKPSRDSEGNDTEIIDNWRINEQNYIGKFSMKIPLVGSIFLFLQSWYGIVALILTVLLVIVIFQIVKMVKKDTTMNYELEKEDNNQEE